MLMNGRVEDKKIEWRRKENKLVNVARSRGNFKVTLELKGTLLLKHDFF